MDAILTIRIDAETHRRIGRLAREQGLTRSAVVREALRNLGEPPKTGDATSAYAAVADLVGSYRSGRADGSVSTGHRFRTALRKRKAR